MVKTLSIIQVLDEFVPPYDRSDYDDLGQTICHWEVADACSYQFDIYWGGEDEALLDVLTALIDADQCDSDTVIDCDPAEGFYMNGFHLKSGMTVRDVFVELVQNNGDMAQRY